MELFPNFLKHHALIHLVCSFQLTSDLADLQQKHSDLLTELDDVNAERESLKFKLADRPHPPISSTPLKRQPPPIDFDANVQLEAQVGNVWYLYCCRILLALHCCGTVLTLLWYSTYIVVIQYFHFTVVVQYLHRCSTVVSHQYQL